MPPSSYKRTLPGNFSGFRKIKRREAHRIGLRQWMILGPHLHTVLSGNRTGWVSAIPAGARLLIDRDQRALSSVVRHRSLIISDKTNF